MTSRASRNASAGLRRPALDGRIETGGHVGGVLLEGGQIGPAQPGGRDRRPLGLEPGLGVAPGRLGQGARDAAGGRPPGGLDRRLGPLAGAVQGEGAPHLGDRLPRLALLGRSVVHGRLQGRPPSLEEAPSYRENTPTSSICGDHRNWSTGKTRSRRKPASTSSLASRAKVAGLHDTPTTRATLDLAISTCCSKAPARGGSSTATSTLFSSVDSTGRRVRSRASAVIAFRPGAVPSAPFRAAMAGAELSAA